MGYIEATAILYAVFGIGLLGVFGAVVVARYL
jgi:hypothetical protein